jgi:hypothetical protein
MYPRASLDDMEKLKFLALLDSNSDPYFVQPVGSHYIDYTTVTPRNPYKMSEIFKCHLPAQYGSSLTLPFAENIRLPIHTAVSQFLHSLHFGCEGHITHNGFSLTLMSLARRKWITAPILQMVGLSVTGHIIIRSADTRTNTRGDYL